MHRGVRVFVCALLASTAAVAALVLPGAPRAQQPPAAQPAPAPSGAPSTQPPPAPGGGVTIEIDIAGRGAKKLNIAVPEFTVTAGPDPGGLGKGLAQVAGADLTFSGLFAVVTPPGPLPLDNPAGFKKTLLEYAAAGAHA